MIFLNAVLKPEYLFRPSQIVRRLRFRPNHRPEILPLPWSTGIYARTSESIGRAIGTQGVYDLPVTEALTRLVMPGETAVDVGANIGYMSLVLARAAGCGGKVIAFEPDPTVLPYLRRNIAMWEKLSVASIQLYELALSDRVGAAMLCEPADFVQNQGTATLENAQGGIRVNISSLDQLAIGQIGVMKIDVEGHEYAVFRGSTSLLQHHKIRDIIFEEHSRYPAPSHQLLLDYGYKIYLLTRTTGRPLLLKPDDVPRQHYLPVNYLATLDPDRAERQMSHWGWRSLSH